MEPIRIKSFFSHHHITKTLKWCKIGKRNVFKIRSTFRYSTSLLFKTGIRHKEIIGNKAHCPYLHRDATQKGMSWWSGCRLFVPDNQWLDHLENWTFRFYAAGLFQRQSGFLFSFFWDCKTKKLLFRHRFPVENYPLISQFSCPWRASLKARILSHNHALSFIFYSHCFTG